MVKNSLDGFSCEMDTCSSIILNVTPSVEMHPNYLEEVGYYDISGNNDFKMFITKTPNIINRLFVRIFFGWKYYPLLKEK